MTVLAQIRLTWSNSVSRCHLYGSDLYRMSRPIIWVQLLLGRMPYSIEKGSMKYSFKSLPFFYAACVTIVHIGLHVHYKQHLVRQWETFVTGLSFTTIMYSVMVLCQIPMWLTTFYAFVYDLPAMVANYNKTAVLESEISEATGTTVLTNETKNRITILTGLYLATSISFGCLLLYVQYHESPWIIMFSFMTNFISKQCYCVIWCLHFFYVKAMGKKLHEHLQKSQKDCSEKLRSCRNLWFHVWEMSQEYSDAFALPILTTLFSYGLLFIISLYGLITTFKKSSSCWAETFELVPYFSVTTTQLYAIIETTHQASSQMSEAFLRSLVSTRPEPFDKQVDDEIDKFVNVVTTMKSKITLKGYVTVERKIILSMLSSAVTYLIVLLELKANEEGTESYIKSLNFANATSV